MSAFTLAELCAVACAEAWRGDGEILASPIGLLPALFTQIDRRRTCRHAASDRRGALF